MATSKNASAKHERLPDNENPPKRNPSLKLQLSDSEENEDLEDDFTKVEEKKKQKKKKKIPTIELTPDNTQQNNDKTPPLTYAGVTLRQPNRPKYEDFPQDVYNNMTKNDTDNEEQSDYTTEQLEIIIKRI